MAAAYGAILTTIQRIVSDTESSGDGDVRQEERRVERVVASGAPRTSGSGNSPYDAAQMDATAAGCGVYPDHMCRNIRQLHNFEPPATDDEARAAALQYVRKISGAPKPSQANAAAFDQAVDDIAAITIRLLAELTTTAPAKNREVEAAKARARSAERYA